MDDLTLYGVHMSPFVQRVVMQLERKGVGYSLESPEGGTASDAFRTINPVGKVPVLVVDGVAFAESAVICLLLEDLFPEPPLRPDDAIDRARGDLIARIGDLYVMNPMAPLFANLSRKGRDDRVVEAAIAELGRGLAALDHWIARDAYAVAKMLSLADLSIAPILRYVAEFLPMFDIANPFAEHRNVTAYYDACRNDELIDAGLCRIEDGWAEMRKK